MLVLLLEDTSSVVHPSFACWHRLGGRSYPCVVDQTPASEDLAIAVQFGWAFCVLPGDKGSLAIPWQGPALLFGRAEIGSLCRSFHASLFP